MGEYGVCYIMATVHLSFEMLQEEYVTLVVWETALYPYSCPKTVFHCNPKHDLRETVPPAGGAEYRQMHDYEPMKLNIGKFL